jgi:hypothetical protein
LTNQAKFVQVYNFDIVLILILKRIIILKLILKLLKKAIPVYESLLKSENTEKDKTILIENLAKILSDSKINDQVFKI